MNSNNKLTGQYFHESIPDIDYKGDQFIDISTDWNIESHSKHYKDYRPKRLPPFKSNIPKIALCYSSKSDFSVALPPWLTPLNVIKALKNKNLRLNATKKQYV
ncbi:MAG: hypothetical protein EZS28_055744, partial [Streblomastix strix]